MSRNGKFRWGLALFYILAYLAPLGFRPMVAPDEFRYAEIPREMIESGDWNNPRLLRVPYYEKPAFGYQLTAGSFLLFGYNRFALRLPAALAAGLAAFMLWLLGKRMWGEEKVGLLAAGFYLLCGLVYGVGTFAVLDSQLAGAVTLSIAAFYLATESRSRRGALLWLATSGAAAGIAFLIKGLPGLAIPGMVLGGWLVWLARWRDMRASKTMRIAAIGFVVAAAAAGIAAGMSFGAAAGCGAAATVAAIGLAVALLYGRIGQRLVQLLVPTAAAVAVILPLAWAQHRAQPDFWHYFIVVEHIERFLRGTADSKPEPFWYFIPVFLGGIFPAALWLPAAWRGWRKRWKSDLLGTPAGRLMLLWWLLPFLFFSVASAKLGTYILPCFAPFALWLAAGVARNVGLRIQAWVLRCLGFLLVFAAVGFSAYQLAADAGWWPGVYAPQEKWWLAVTALAMLWGFLLASSFHGERLQRLIVFFAGAGVLLLIGPLATPQERLDGKMPERGLDGFHARGLPEPGMQVVVVRSTMQTVPWCWRTDDVAIWGNEGELNLGNQNRSVTLRRFPDGVRGIREMRREIPRGKGLLVIRSEADDCPFPPELEALETDYLAGIWIARF